MKLLEKCPLCEGRSIREYKYKVSSNNLEGDRRLYSLSYCKNCHHLFTNPKPPPDYLVKLYNKVSEDGAILTEERDCSLLKLVKLSYSFSRNFINFKKGERLLDVGCGNGLYLDFAKSRGVEVYGNDVDECQLRPIINRFGRERIRIGELTDNSWDSEFFDYITLWHQFEHDFDPVTTIREIHRILKPSGKVIIDVPSIDSIERSVFGRYWSMYTPPFHLNHFSPKSITRLLEENGFIVLKVRFPFFKPTSFLLSLLYTFSKRFNLYLSPRFTFFWVFFLAPFSLPFNLIGSLLGRSSNMIVIAAKRGV